MEPPMSKTEIMRDFNNRNVRLWTRGGKRYSGKFALTRDGFCCISREANPHAPHLIIDIGEVVRVEIIRDKRTFYSESKPFTRVNPE